jgi:hypothetical protein
MPYRVISLMWFAALERMHRPSGVNAARSRGWLIGGTVNLPVMHLVLPVMHLVLPRVDRVTSMVITVMLRCRTVAHFVSP